MSASLPEAPTFDLESLQAAASDTNERLQRVHYILQAISRLSDSMDSRALVSDLVDMAESLMREALDQADNLTATLIDIDFGAIADKRKEN